MRRLARQHLPNSRWTARAALPASDGERHFEVVEVGPGSSPAQVVLRAVLTGRRYRVDVRTLRDAAQWDAGWVSLAAGAPTEPGKP